MNGRELVKFLDVELKRRGISKGEFYAAIGITATAYYGWRNGAVPKAETVEAIEKYLNVDLLSAKTIHLRNIFKALMRVQIPYGSPYKTPQK